MIFLTLNSGSLTWPFSLGNCNCIPALLTYTDDFPKSPPLFHSTAAVPVFGLRTKMLLYKNMQCEHIFSSIFAKLYILMKHGYAVFAVQGFAFVSNI